MSVFLTEQLLTRYNQIALSDIALSVSKLKFKLIYVTGCILLWTEFLGIKLDLDFSARLEHKINMKLVNIFVPKEQKHVYAIQESEKVYLFKSHRVQKNCIRVKCRKKYASEV